VQSAPRPALDLPAQPAQEPDTGAAAVATGEAPPAVVASPAQPVARFRARVRIFVGGGRSFAPGDEIPASVAADGLRRGEHFEVI
jgi:hypothetical protein